MNKLLLGAALAVLFCAPAWAPAWAQFPSDKTTQHEITVAAGKIAFDARVETMKLADPKGASQAEIVTTAFLRRAGSPATPPTARPITFAINGGPGASSAWLDLGAIGPWRVPFGPPSEPPVPVTNADTWLDSTDLVFIDPPGTGFSRVTGGDDARKHFFSVGGDVDTVALVIRRWLETHDRLQSPVFIVGESYGGFRGPRVARALLESQGVGVSGLILISPVLDFNGRESRWTPMNDVVHLPSMAAAYRGATTEAAVSDVETYAAGDYLADLLRGLADPDAVARIVPRVAAFTGLDPALVRRRAGRIDSLTFLRDSRPDQIASLYDATEFTPDPFPEAAFSHGADPLLDGMRAPMTSAMLTIYHDWLGWQPEGAPARQYEVLNNTVFRAWKFGEHLDQPEAFAALRQYVALDQTVHVLVAHGLYDLVTPYFASELLLRQSPQFGPGRQIALHVYAGGHMFYSRDASRDALHRDAADLIAASLAAKR